MVTRSFPDGHHHVAAIGALGVQLDHAHALEDAEGGEATLALEQPVRAQGLAFLESDLAADHDVLRALEARDDHMVHDGPPARLDHEPHVDLRSILREDDLGPHVGLEVTLVTIRGKHGVPVGRQLAQPIGLTLAQVQLGERRVLRHVLGPTLDRDLAHEGARAQAHAEDDRYGSSAFGDLGLDPDLGVAKFLEDARDRPHVGLEKPLFEGKTRASVQDGRRLRAHDADAGHRGRRACPDLVDEGVTPRPLLEAGADNHVTVAQAAEGVFDPLPARLQRVASSPAVADDLSHLLLERA